MNKGLKVLADISTDQRHKMSTDQLLAGYIRAQRRSAMIKKIGGPDGLVESSEASVLGYQKELRDRLEVIASRTHDSEVKEKAAWEASLASMFS